MLNRQFRAGFMLLVAIGLVGAAEVPQRNFDQWQLPGTVAGALGQRSPERSCESLLATRSSEGVTIRKALLEQLGDGAGKSCTVTIEVTAPQAPDITVWLMLPIQHRNGRFLGLGGGGWLPGVPAELRAGALLGFATVITNAGRHYDLSSDPEELGRIAGHDDFLIDANGHLDTAALRIFAYLGIHEMTVAGKAVTREFYGVDPRYSYFTGCSTGGRQGQSEVQHYPKDYDGVLSGSPAINWAHFAMAEFWPVAVTNELGLVAPCKFETAHRAVVAACADDGARDGLVSRVGACRFDLNTLLGQRTECGVIDAHDVDVIRRIWDGPRRPDGSRLWSGIDPAVLIHSPANGPAEWTVPFFAGKALDVADLTTANFEKVFDQFTGRYGAVMDTANADLSDFSKHGGKTIIWHGVADDIIPAAGSVHYVEAIRHSLGTGETDGFLRLYLAPGVGRCGFGGDGPLPVELMKPLMEWVEQGRAPAAVRGEHWDEVGRVTRTRPLCPDPQRALYRGRGSVDNAANFSCQR
jgi:Tannase and feruloyl esterase